MRAHTVAAVVAVVLVLCAGFGWAQGWDGGDLWTADDVRDAPLPSWFGGTGLIVVPTAQTIAPTDVQAHLHVIDVEGEWQTVWGANVSIYEGLEGGVTGLDEAYTGAGQETVYQAKYCVPLDRLFGLDPRAPTLAVGGRDLSDEINRAWYVVLSKELPLDPNGDNTALFTLGVGETELPDSPLDGLFGGVDLTIFDYARLQLEHDGENFNAALRYWWSEWAVTEIGVLDDNMGYGFTLVTGF